MRVKSLRWRKMWRAGCVRWCVVPDFLGCTMSAFCSSRFDFWISNPGLPMKGMEEARNRPKFEVLVRYCRFWNLIFLFRLDLFNFGDQLEDAMSFQ
ncbi:hypothetical protein BZA77DRAFT_173817 [Pyronema omphalodes]|nr:hypothetical protein BZA77DRAFT_173817 [Pyronema omphalodes]